MATQATNTTPNYHLSQWEPDDHILRSDFNADFLAIDTALNSQKQQSAAAIAAAESRIAVQRLATARLSAAAASLTVDLSGTDLSRYARLLLHISNAAGASGSVQTLRLTVNGDETAGDYITLERTSTLASVCLNAGQISTGGGTHATVTLQELSGQLLAESSYFRISSDSADSGGPNWSLWTQGGLADIHHLTLKTAGVNLKKDLSLTVYGWQA